MVTLPLYDDKDITAADGGQLQARTSEMALLCGRQGGGLLLLLSVLFVLFNVPVCPLIYVHRLSIVYQQWTVCCVVDCVCHAWELFVRKKRLQMPAPD